MIRLVGEWLAAGQGMAVAFALLAVAVLLGCGAPLAWIDARTRRLPDRLTRPLAAALIPSCLIAGMSAGEPGRALRSLLGALGAGLLFLALHALSPGSLGFGDVKLVPSLGAITALVSWGNLLLAGVAAALIGGAHAAVVMALRREARAHIAFGPALVVGAVAALCV